MLETILSVVAIVEATIRLIRVVAAWIKEIREQ